MERSEGLELERKTRSAEGIVLAGAEHLAVLAGSCCVLPMALALVGIGGSWVWVLGPIVTYRSFIWLGVAGVLFGPGSASGGKGILIIRRDGALQSPFLRA